MIVGAPADVTASCDNLPLLPTVTATDNCTNDANIQITLNELSIPGSCANNYSLIRTWTATDECGNSTQVTQTITIEDTESPILAGIPADITASCISEPAPGTPTATDNCSAVTDILIEFNEVRTDGTCAGSYILVRTWTATDECGNQDVGTQTITVEDITPPTFTFVPGSVNSDCNSVPAPSDPTATDDCGGIVTIALVETTQPGACSTVDDIIRTWTATDECGNTATAQQTVSVTDGTPPVFANSPVDETIDCAGTIPSANVSATDDCDTDVEVVMDETTINGNCPGNFQIIRTWTATDDCGNIATQSQTITIEDTEAPVLSGIPANTSASCDFIPQPANPTATDNCSSDVSIVYNEQRTELGCPGNYILTRTWIANDGCGNESVGIQTITVEDTSPPILLSCLLYTSPSPRDQRGSRMPSSA